MAGSGDRTQERRGSRQVLAIERRRTRRARRRQFRASPGAVRVEHVSADTIRRLRGGAWEVTGDGGAL